LLPSYFRFLASHRGALAFGFLLTFFSSVGQTFFIALFNRQIRDVYDLTSGEFGTIYAVASLTSAMLMIRAGARSTIWPLALFAGSVVAGLTIAAILMAVLPPGHIWVLFIAIVLLRLCGQGLMFHTAVTAAVRTFHAHRGQAISIVSLGFAAGEATLPVTIVAVVSAIGWRMTWAAAAVSCWCSCCRWRSGWRTAAIRPPAGGQRRGVPPSDRSRAQVLRDPAFYLLLPAMAGARLRQHRRVLPSGADLRGQGLDAHRLRRGLHHLRIFHPGHDAGRRPAGRPFQRQGHAALRPRAHPRSGPAPAVGRRCAVDRPWLHGLAGATTGLYYGAANAVWAELYGLTHLGAIRAMTHSFMMVSAALAPSADGMDARLRLRHFHHHGRHGGLCADRHRPAPAGADRPPRHRRAGVTTGRAAPISDVQSRRAT
jgi:hypothetical protein